MFNSLDRDQQSRTLHIEQETARKSVLKQKTDAHPK